MDEQWYKVIGEQGHQGAGRSSEVVIYFWTRDALEARNRYGKFSGIKKGKILSATRVNEEKVPELEAQMVEDGLSLKEAKERWYTQNKEYVRW